MTKIQDWLKQQQLGSFLLLALVLLALSLPMAWLLRLIPGAGKWLT